MVRNRYRTRILNTPGLKYGPVLKGVTRVDMYHITVSSDTFELTKIQDKQNPYIDLSNTIVPILAKQQHTDLIDELTHNIHFKLKTKSHIPDMVFVASMGLSLPCLPEPLVVLPHMRYSSRRRELKYIEEILQDLRIKTIALPEDVVFEGQAETAWFDGGRLLVVGYGFRSSKETVAALRTLLTEVYTSYGVEPPKVVGARLRSPDFYHLDMALLAYSPTAAFVQTGVFAPSTLERLRKEIGSVTEIQTSDKFALNSIIEHDKILCHATLDPQVKTIFETKIGLPVQLCDTSEYEKSGGSVRCLVFDVFDPRIVKRKNNNKTPTSPRSPHA